MAFVGRRQRTTGTITATGNVIIRIKDCLGARRILVMLSGGTGANAVDAEAAEGVEKDGTVAGSSGIPLVIRPTSIGLLANKTYPEGDFFTIVYDGGVASGPPDTIPTPEVLLSLSVATGDVTGVNVDAYPIFDNVDQALSYRVLPA